ncbi:DUF6261 family protein [Ancylomarina longa]|nr:DUF6261 family protein [Ancylomarina longa]
MFEPIYLSHLRNNEFIQFVKNFLSVLNENELETLKLKPEYDELQALFATMVALYMPKQSSQFTKTLQEDDNRRDKAFVGIQSMINAYAYHYDAGKKEAADILLNSLKKYGSQITKQNYQGETATITAIIQEWKREIVLVDALSKLLLTDWVNELETSNMQFDAHYLERIKEDAASPEIKIVDLRKKITQVYRNLSSRIYAFSIISEVPTYSDIIKRSNSLIEKYNFVVDARTTRDAEQVSTTEE